MTIENEWTAEIERLRAENLRLTIQCARLADENRLIRKGVEELIGKFPIDPK